MRQKIARPSHDCSKGTKELNIYPDLAGVYGVGLTGTTTLNTITYHITTIVCDLAVGHFGLPVSPHETLPRTLAAMGRPARCRRRAVLGHHAQLWVTPNTHLNN
jgi:hypothetical protein